MSSSKNTYIEKSLKRIDHIISHLDSREDDLEEAKNHIVRGTGNPIACLYSLESHALAKGMFSWFKLGELASSKQWFYTAAVLVKKARERDFDTSGPLARKRLFLEALLSDNKEIISWSASAEPLFNPKNIDNEKKLEYLTYNFMLGLRGEWDRLIDRCETVLKAPSSALKRYVLDFEFYLALAKGDESSMTEVLLELTKPKIINARSNDESGYTDNLISTYAVIYAKTAWYHGYQITPDTPYIPRAWLPIEPLPVYQKQYSFL